MPRGGDGRDETLRLGHSEVHCSLQPCRDRRKPTPPDGMCPVREPSPDHAWTACRLYCLIRAEAGRQVPGLRGRKQGRARRQRDHAGARNWLDAREEHWGCGGRAQGSTAAGALRVGTRGFPSTHPMNGRESCRGACTVRDPWSRGMEKLIMRPRQQCQAAGAGARHLCPGAHARVCGAGWLSASNNPLAAIPRGRNGQQLDRHR